MQWLPPSEREAALVWGRASEPGDQAAATLVAACGFRRAFELVAGGVSGQEAAALTSAATPVQWERALTRWRTRLAGEDPQRWVERDLRALELLGASFFYRGQEGYPSQFLDLGSAAPLGLWVRGEAGLLHSQLSVALVGARAATGYGERVARDLTLELCRQQPGLVAVSGGAYGIDACVHRAALAADGNTVAFLAGGVDRLYPAGNADLLQEVAEHGAVVSEMPPGAVPSRVRFLQRNRLIACAGATVVAEAAVRSGALNTATHAVNLGRSVGAVPGPATSQQSAGCHRLIRDGATLVTSAPEVLELLPALAWELGEQAPSPDDQLLDGLDATGRMVLDALPLRASAPLEQIAKRAALAADETETALALLEMAGRVRRAATHPPRWTRAN
ncbi:MAG: DNA-processing protein DprA [Buchananella hordeovulneris]|nr:DNA-processing protein DprA [Buchananella hordeovulneris]